MNSIVVLDASAILAVVYGEPGHENLPPQLLARAVASLVNLAEAQSKLVSLGWKPEVAWGDARGLISEAIPFDEAHARATGDLIMETRNLGLSLGDRACLALGLQLGARIYTADRAWKKLRLPVEIHVIR